MSLDLFSLKGKTALVTGANTGLGQAIAVALAAAGANIVAAGRSSASDTRHAVEATGARFHEAKADFSSTKPIPGLVDEAHDAFGSLDILINNAGIIRRNDALQFTEEDWDAVMDTNLKSAFFLSQAVARRWVVEGKGGKILNLSD